MDSPTSPIGDVLTLVSGEASAEITTVGAHLRRFTVGGREAIVPFGEDLPWGAHGAVLAPWPNRIEDGRYSWHGTSYQLPITDPERNTAIHGFVMTKEWAVSARTEDSATLTLTPPPEPGYPFQLRLVLTYRLAGHDLRVEFAAENLGSTPAPFAVGFHPWLAAGPGGLEAATLQFDAAAHFPPDDRLIPGPPTGVPGRFDFSRARAIADTRFDDAFAAPPLPRGQRSWLHLDCQDGHRISAWMTPPLTVWQLCSDPGPSPRPGLAVEPMSSPANAFNTGCGLHTLEPRRGFDAAWGLRVALAGG